MVLFNKSWLFDHFIPKFIILYTLDVFLNNINELFIYDLMMLTFI